VRIVLSGVARTRGRYGKIMISQMLCGSGSEKMKRLRLDKLSTFGLLAHLKQTDVAELIAALIAAQCLEQTELERFRPLLQLTPLGTDVMSGRAQLAELPLAAGLFERLRRGAPGAANAAGAANEPTTTSSDTGEEGDPAVFARLRTWRNQLATQRGQPAYQVFSNGTLQEICRQMPSSLDELARIKGIGEVKLRQFGDALLQLLAGGKVVDTAAAELAVVADPEHGSASHEDTFEPAFDEVFALTREATEHVGEAVESRAGEPAPVDPPPAEPESSVGHDETAAAPTPHAQPAHYWTWRLLEAGFAVDECAAIRGLSEEVVADHALRAADAGWEVAAEWLLSPRLIARLEQVIGDTEPARIRPLLSQLPNGTRYEQILFFLKCRQQSRLRS
jgi:ATP-dependent DNA helicase RecQ